MRGFKFSLEKVLRLRRNIQDQVLGEFEIVLGEARLADGQWRSLIQEREAGRAMLREERGKASLDAKRILLLEAGLGRLEEEIRTARKRLEAAEAEVEETRTRLREATQKREMLERLKARHLRRFNTALKAEETKALNEIAVIRFKRNEYESDGIQDRRS
ncbi:MAG: flagellar export protein FliJ [Planctomycetota bacterium]|jgi:flagellar FliJ protein